MNHKNLKGSLSIGRVRSNVDDGYVSLTLHDESSGTEFVTVRISPESFAEALLGLSFVECQFDLRAERVGKIYEHKEEIVSFDGGYAAPGLPRENAAAPVLAPFEVDGWKGRVDDLFNSHRRTKDGYRVTFTRYIDPPRAVEE